MFVKIEMTNSFSNEIELLRNNFNFTSHRVVVTSAKLNIGFVIFDGARLSIETSG
jgi:hypothetical protein